MTTTTTVGVHTPDHADPQLRAWLEERARTLHALYEEVRDKAAEVASADHLVSHVLQRVASDACAGADEITLLALARNPDVWPDDRDDAVDQLTRRTLATRQ